MICYPQAKLYSACSVLVVLISKGSNGELMSCLLSADVQSARHRAESKANEEGRSAEKKQRAALR